MRVYELAKELNRPSKDVLETVRGLGIEVKSHSGSISAEAVDRVRQAYAAEQPPSVPEPKPEPPPPPVTPPPPAPTPEPEPKPEPEPEPKPATPREPPRADTRPAPAAEAPPEKTLKIRGQMVVKDLAAALDMPSNRLIAELMGLNILAAINERVDMGAVRKIAEKHGFTVKQERRAVEHKPVLRKKEDEEPEAEDRPEDLQPRPPVVTFLGHVDHGKTSLLDAIRKTAVVKGESGGITQHIGAYTVDVQGRAITFLDTPGHAAFTAMRARGANLTDIAVIIIAADDGIMPQTREAISHARAAGVAIMVAINKTDLPGANPERVRQQLQGENLAPEEWGGSTICCEVSAVTGAGIAHLLEMILLQADILELKANPKRLARGFVIEARLEQGMGPTANLLVRAGTLRVGDTVLCGSYFGRVRALINDQGHKINSAGPATPVQCLGLSGVPEAGAAFRVCKNDRAARSLAETDRQQQKRDQLGTPRKASLETLFSRLEETEKVELKLVLKADTQGSVEAIRHALEEIESNKVSLSILLSGTGNITENDVMLARASKAVVLGFHIGKEPGVDALAAHEGVEIRLHTIIYELIDEVRDAMRGLLAPVLKDQVLGHAEIRQVFTVGKRERVAGCLVTNGHATARARVRVRRGQEVLFAGRVLSLKHFQDSVAEVRESQECGIRIDGYTMFDVGDILEFYESKEVEQTL
jgi:translation initiation factor IF-2